MPGPAPTAAPAFASDEALLPAIAQDAQTGAVLMLAWMNRRAYEETLRTGRAVYYSRSRGRLWRKGEQSGHSQLVEQVLIDCDADTVLLRVHQQGGAACHQGYATCFYREITPHGTRVVGQRVFNPDEVYTNPNSHNHPNTNTNPSTHPPAPPVTKAHNAKS